MSAKVNVCNVQLLENPIKLEDPFRIEITFECLEEIPEGVDWELVYVRSEGKQESDRVLDCVETGHLKEGLHKFTLESPPPEPTSLSVDDLMDVTLLLLRCSFKEQKFISIGWYVTHAYTEKELAENPPAQPAVDKMLRHIATGDMRVTTYAIKWGESEELPPEGGVEEDGASEAEDDDEEGNSEETDEGEESEDGADMEVGEGLADGVYTTKQPVEESMENCHIAQNGTDTEEKKAKTSDVVTGTTPLTDETNVE